MVISENEAWEKYCVVSRGTRCMGSKCMGWRWQGTVKHEKGSMKPIIEKSDKGFCGLCYK